MDGRGSLAPAPAVAADGDVSQAARWSHQAWAGEVSPVAAAQVEIAVVLPVRGGSIWFQAPLTVME